ncbi:nuclear transport factor 2 family protein [Devosia sp.]|uniref:nuclear transport factor 2 family protein n=1 Tax=Devosia sp. TaxID=1871048 RepID=UPI002FC7054D
MQTSREARLQNQFDRTELFDLVRRERFARDQQRFGVMAACFHRDAYVRTSWYDGTGGDAYVAATRKWMSNTGNSKHWVFPAFAQVQGHRATIESPAMIFNRARLEDIEIDFQVFCRFFSRAVREDGDWKLASFHVLFERDVMGPTLASDPLPIDRQLLDTMRPSYKFLTYIQRSRGIRVNQDLLGDDRPDQLAEFHAGEDRWLAGEGPVS